MDLRTDLKREISRLVPLARTVLGLASGQPELLGPVDLTILFTDIEGYTGLTEEIGDKRALALVRTHNRIVRKSLANMGGVEVKQTGDGIMSYFLSAARALECAVEIQRDCDDYNSTTQGPPLQVAIGLNTGAPVVDNGDIFGAAVNIASRIAERAPGGRVVVSDVVRLLTAGKGFHFHEIGTETLDGLQEPVRLFDVPWRQVPRELAIPA